MRRQWASRTELVLISEIYDPGQWSNFFVLVGTGSAALTGLVFVAMTLNLKGVAEDGTHRYRAINMITGFTSAFLVSSLALMGHQTHRSLGIEWLIVAIPAGAINTNGYVQAFRLNSSLYALSRLRIVGGSACYLAQIVGALVLFLGSSAGLYVGATAMVVNFGFLISGSWLLIMGTLPTSNPDAGEGATGADP